MCVEGICTVPDKTRLLAVFTTIKCSIVRLIVASHKPYTPGGSQEILSSRSGDLQSDGSPLHKREGGRSINL